MNRSIKPIYLFADSQPLFWAEDGVFFLASINEHIEKAAPKAAYIGASNDDNPDYYSIFEAAMENIGIRDCKMIRSSFSADDQSYVQEADIILLAGGDTERGWNMFQRNGLTEILVNRYYDGAILLGVSAGAVQMGLVGWSEQGDSARNIFYTLRLIPLVIGAHEEEQGWENLKKAMQFLGDPARGIGIPKGGGLIYHPDHTVEPVRFPLYEFHLQDQQLTYSLLLPGETQSIEESPGLIH